MNCLVCANEDIFDHVKYFFFLFFFFFFFLPVFSKQKSFVFLSRLFISPFSSGYSRIHKEDNFMQANMNVQTNIEAFKDADKHTDI